jgi:hypothetical protein
MSRLTWGIAAVGIALLHAASAAEFAVTASGRAVPASFSGDSGVLPAPADVEHPPIKFSADKVEVLAPGRKFTVVPGQVLIIPANASHKLVVLEGAVTIGCVSPILPDGIDTDTGPHTLSGRATP